MDKKLDIFCLIYIDMSSIFKISGFLFILKPIKMTASKNSKSKVFNSMKQPLKFLLKRDLSN